MSNAFDDSKIMPSAAARARAADALAKYNAWRPASQMAVYRNFGLLLLLGAFLFGCILWLNQTPEAGEKNSPQAFAYAILAGTLAVLFYFGRIVLARAWQPATQLQQRSRNELMPLIFSFVDDLQYGNGFEPDFMRDFPANSILQHTRIQYDDSITGAHDGLVFSLCECKFWQNQGKNERVMFQGAIFHCKAPQNFPGVLFLSERLPNSWQSWFKASDCNHFPKMEIDDDGISRLYSVRSSNPIAAKAELDGNLGSALIWLYEAWPEGELRLVLSEDNIFLMVPSNKNFFELPKIEIEVDYSVHVEPMVRELAMLLATGSLVRKALLPEAEVIKVGIDKN